MSKEPNKLPEISDDVIASLDKIAGILAAKFKFGYHTYEDMKQEGILVGLECLERYNPEKSALETFLWTHIHNRLFNFKRKRYMRPAQITECCSEEELCVKCERKRKYSNTKRNLTYPLSLYLVQDEEEPTMSEPDTTQDTASYNEMMEILNEKLPPHIRANFLKMLAGVPVSSVARLRVQELVGEVLREYDYIGEDGSNLE